MKSKINPWCLLLAGAGVALATPGRAAGPPNADGTPVNVPRTGEFVFSILPKSFQKSPQLEMTVVTEFTPYGRMLRPASPSDPAYFVAQAGGFKQLGDVSDGEISPPLADLERAINKALATNGFLPGAWPDRVPTLAVFYSWGSHNKLPPDLAARFPQLAAKQNLERAMLVGGHQFMLGINERMEYGDSILDHNQRMDYLTEQADDDLYFVIASAYDYGSLAKGKRQLVWRTTMTVASKGVSMKETLTPLIATSAPFLGRETNGPEIAMRRISREGRVEIGTPVVVPDIDPSPPAAPATKDKKSP